jgi:predicted DsbA family dithiol-disulfide isomerase
MPPLVLDVWADIACPWCRIGRRRLAAALEEEEPGAVVVTHRAFELQPDLPPEGLPAHEFYARKFGSPGAMLEAFTRVAEAGAADGLAFDWKAMRRAPNTRLAHRLVKLAGAHGPAHADEALDALYRGHFAEGADIADPATAIALVREATGIEVDAALVAGGAAEEEVRADEEAARAIGISGVPFFLAGGAVAVSGAHEPGVLRDLLAAARERLAAEGR